MAMIQLKDEILASCNALGFMEGEKYMKEPDCLETLKEILKYLKKDNEYHDARYYLGNQSIVQHDLIPLIIFYHKDKNLFDILIKLLANLTHPIILLYQNKKPQDVHGQKRYIELNDLLSLYKKAFMNVELFQIIKEKLSDLLQLEWDQTFEEENYFIEYILVLIRNILFDDSLSPALDATNNINAILYVFEKSGIYQLFLYLAISEDHHAFNMHVLEIIYLIYIGYDAERIANLENSTKINDEISKLRKIEHIQQKSLNKQRRDRFKGTYCLQGFKSISENDMITHTISGDIKDLLKDCDRKPIKKSKNRSSVGQKITKPITSPNTHRFLHDFAVKFLRVCYNSFMKNVKDKLLRNNSLESDETHYLWTIAFFMEFARHLDFDVKYYSETLNNDMIHYLVTTINTYGENVLDDRENALRWAKRAHLALMAYKQILFTLNRLSLSGCEEVKEGVKVIKANLFYMPEYRDVLMHAFRTYNPVYYSIDYLKDLIELTHVFIKMLKCYCQEYKHLPVMKRKKKRKVRRKHKKREENSAEQQENPLEENTVKPWQDSYEKDLEEVLVNSTFDLDNSEIKVFDCTLDYDMEEQKLHALYKVQLELRRNAWDKAVETLKLCRNMWPEDALFGNPNMSTGEDIAALKEIYEADIPKSDFIMNGKGENSAKEASETIEDEDISEEYEDSEDEDKFVEAEDQFDLNRFLHSFANPTVVKCYSLVMKEFNTNTTFTNHCVAKMCYRIAVELQLPAMFFQLSYFKIFQDILQACTLNKENELKDIQNFALYITRKFIKTVKTNKLAYVDALFWKTAKESREVITGYDKEDSSNSHAKYGWSEEQEFELETLYERFVQEHGGSADNFGKVEVDELMEYLERHLTGASRTRRQIVLQCGRQGLHISKRASKKSRKIGENRNVAVDSGDSDTNLGRGANFSRVWKEEDEAKIIALHVMHHRDMGSQEMIRLMEEELDFDYTQDEIKNKLVSLNLNTSQELNHISSNKSDDYDLLPKKDPFDEILELSDHDSDTSLHIDLSVLNGSQQSDKESFDHKIASSGEMSPQPSVDNSYKNLNDSPPSFSTKKSKTSHQIISSDDED